MSNSEKLPERVYEYVAEEGEERACDAISDSSCKETPGNFFLNGLNGFSTKLAEQLASPQLIIPYVFSLIGVPSFFSGLLVPIKNTGSLLPQLFVSAKIRSYPKRKYFWTIAALIQALSMFAIGWVVFELQGFTAGWVVLFFVLLFNMSSGVGSISFKDVLAKTIPKGKRGRLLSFRATGGGILTILAGLILYFGLRETKSNESFGYLFIAAGLLWILGSVLFSLIKEEKGATEGGRTPIRELKNGIRLFKEDSNFKNFLIARALLLSIPLVQPFFVLYATDRFDLQVSGMGIFVIITGISNSVSSPFWGKYSDRSSRKVMMLSALMGVFTGAFVILFQFLPDSLQNEYVFSITFFLIIISYGGARMGRKTYLVDYAPSDERPLYVSVANTFMGIMTLLSGLLSLVAGFFGVDAMILALMFLMVVSIFASSRLKEI